MLRTIAIVAVLTLTAAACSSDDAADNSSSTVPPLGEPAAAEQPLWLYSFTADGATATVDGDSVTVELTGAAQSATAFTDRPERRARQISTPGILAQWDTLFTGDPPNASITGRTEGNEPRTWVVEIDTATATADATIRFEGRLLDGDSTPDRLNDVAVFIDDVTAPHCTAHIPWFDYLLAPQIASAMLFRVVTTTTSETIALEMTEPAGTTPAVSIEQISATRGGTTVDLPAAQMPEFTVSSGAASATVPAIDTWVGGDDTEPAVLEVMVTAEVPGLAQASLDCDTAVTVPAGS